jgi:hypothetical protein
VNALRSLLSHRPPRTGRGMSVGENLMLTFMWGTMYVVSAHDGGNGLGLFTLFFFVFWAFKTILAAIHWQVEQRQR